MVTNMVTKPGIDNEGYCIDCFSDHNCFNCDRMNFFIGKYINNYNKRLLESLGNEKVDTKEINSIYEDPYDSEINPYNEYRKNFNK